MKAFAKKLIAVLLGVFVGLIFLEILCQAYFAVAVTKSLEAQRNDELHYYTASDDPTLRYVLKPGYQIEKDGKRIAINQDGIRDDSDTTEFRRPKVALLGDSVSFGVALSQEETPSAALQQLAGDSIKVLNFAVPGYGLKEIQRYLEVKFPVYKPERIYFVLNLNDFTRRDSFYEGADDGLYRIYHYPVLKLPFFIRKGIYRYVKEGRMSSVRWYRWLYRGNKEKGLAIIERMALFATGKGSRFTVVVFPARVAYERGHFVMQDVVDEIGASLGTRGIPFISPVNAFGDDPASLQDDTDHLTAAGSKVMAAVIWGDVSAGH
jgi:hypothetical protein